MLNNISLCRPRRGFTLVEILAVVAIMTVLLVVGMPALKGNRDAGMLRQAGNIAADLAVVGRQAAVTSNKPTALLISNKTTNPDNLSGRAMILMQLDSSRIWKPLDKWQVLPEGTFVQNNSNDSNGSIVSLSALPTADGFQAPKLRGTTVAATDCKAFVFQTDGSVWLDGIALTPKIVVGLDRDKNNALTGNYYEVIFNPSTGTSKVVRP